MAFDPFYHQLGFELGEEFVADSKKLLIAFLSFSSVCYVNSSGKRKEIGERERKAKEKERERERKIVEKVEEGRRSVSK